MKVLVCVKQCFDPESKIVVDGGEILETGLRLTINPYDVVALTQASKLRKAGVVDEVVAVMVESNASDSSMRHALAVGADRGIVAVPKYTLDQTAVVSVLAGVIAEEAPDLIMMGHLSSDRSSSQIAARLSLELGLPAITMASSIEIEDGAVVGTHDLDDGRVVSRAQLPAIVSVQVYMTQAHYVAMKSLMQAKKKVVEVIECDVGPGASRVICYEGPASKTDGTIVKGEPSVTAFGLAKWIRDVAGVDSKVG